MSCAVPEVRLRELRASDIPTLNGWRQDREVVALLGCNYRFINQSIDIEWFETYMHSRESNVRLSIEVVETGEYIGNANLTGIQRINQSAEFSIMIGERRFWSQGVGFRATQLVLRHAFCDLNVNRVHLTVLKDNVRARRLYERVGFSEEGCQRQAIYKDGKFCDVVLMAILKSEFEMSADRTRIRNDGTIA